MDYRFNVGRDKLYRADGVDTGYDALFNEDNGHQISVVSRDYQLITHAEAVDRMHSIFDSMGETVEDKKIHVMNNGRKLFTELQMKDHEFDVVGDSYSPTIIMENSLDKTKSFKVRFGLFRFVCSNGAIWAVNEAEKIDMPHFLNNVDFETIGDKIRINLDSLITQFSNDYRNMATKNLTEKMLVDFLKDEKFPIFFRIEVANMLIEEQLAEFEWEKVSNFEKPVNISRMDAFNMCVWWNVLTNVATHKIQSTKKQIALSQQISKYIR